MGGNESLYLDVCDSRKNLLNPLKFGCLLDYTLKNSVGVLNSIEYKKYAKWWLKNRRVQKNEVWNVRKSSKSLGYVKTWTLLRLFQPWREEMEQLLARLEMAGINLKTVGSSPSFDTNKNIHKRGTQFTSQVISCSSITTLPCLSAL